jgi:hypothetical protein
MATATASLNGDAKALPPSLTSTEALQSLSTKHQHDSVVSHQDVAIYTIGRMSELHCRVSKARTETSQDRARFERLQAVRAAIPANAFPDPFATGFDT